MCTAGGPYCDPGPAKRLTTSTAAYKANPTPKNHQAMLQARDEYMATDDGKALRQKLDKEAAAKHAKETKATLAAGNRKIAALKAELAALQAKGAVVTTPSQAEQTFTDARTNMEEASAALATASRNLMANPNDRKLLADFKKAERANSTASREYNQAQRTYVLAGSPTS